MSKLPQNEIRTVSPTSGVLATFMIAYPADVSMVRQLPP
ncbi:hypothetical protein EC036_24810 [Enterobacter cloacae]|nr:hypothetical protein EC036_24810 [Enterobacter cloacae]